MKLPPEEPAAGPWRVEPIADVAGTLLGRPPAPDGRPVILAVDGRGSSGKTSLSRRLAEAVPGSAVVHTDDIAWWHAAARPRAADRAGRGRPAARAQALTLAMCSAV